MGRTERAGPKPPRHMYRLAQDGRAGARAAAKDAPVRPRLTRRICNEVFRMGTCGDLGTRWNKWFLAQLGMDRGRDDGDVKSSST